MNVGGVCIITDNAPRLAEFYKILLQEAPYVEGNHYGFGKLAIYDPGEKIVSNENHIWMQCFDDDIDALFERLLREIPGIEIVSPPERRPWGAYSFWIADPDGNKIAVAQTNGPRAN